MSASSSSASTRCRSAPARWLRCSCITWVVCYRLPMRLVHVQRTPSLRDQALLQLRKAVVVGDLEPGSLHSEQTIAASLGLSRTPIREALLQLVAEGMVAFIPNRG